MNKSQIKERFVALNACVLIPTYNNSGTLGKVIEEVLQYTDHVLVVNDGCTDATADVLRKYPQVRVALHEVNRGKGRALQTGFRVAAEEGYRYAITIDSDGQHYPSDLHVFLDKIEKEPDCIIVGSRNMDQSSVPGKSNVGNKISSFWFTVETGIKLPDTQSGYRLYPVQLLKDFKWYSPKYEFEIEVLVRAAWSGINVTHVPVKVFYAPAEERVSHFRPFKDFSRVGVLNTILVTTLLLYIIPRNFVLFFVKKKYKAFIREHFFNTEEPNSRKIISVAFGVFMGIFPVWGFQLIIGIALCHFFKLNKALFVLAANISIPPMIPFIIFFSHRLGGVALQRESKLLFDTSLTYESVRNELIQYYTGAVLLAFAGAITAAVLSIIIVKLFPLNKKAQQEILVNAE
jgi:glycosyltransferase involved in cell wall biosynthesis